MNSHQTLAGGSVQHFYDGRFGQYGVDVRTLWNSRKSQEERFHMLSGVGSLEHARILDVGCGFGDFFDFLKAQSIEVTYTGIDVQPDILEEAKRRNPENTFQRIDVLEFFPQAKFDFVFASGIFALKMENQLDFVKDMLAHMFWLSEKGLAVNFLSSYTTGEKDKDSYFVDPQEILGLALSITPRVVVRHDYRDNDFTAYLFPNPHAMGK